MENTMMKIMIILILQQNVIQSFFYFHIFLKKMIQLKNDCDGKEVGDINTDVDETFAENMETPSAFPACRQEFQGLARFLCDRNLKRLDV